jgi:hypothetical protein
MKVSCTSQELLLQCLFDLLMLGFFEGTEKISQRWVAIGHYKGPVLLVLLNVSLLDMFSCQRSLFIWSRLYWYVDIQIQLFLFQFSSILVVISCTNKIERFFISVLHSVMQIFFLSIKDDLQIIPFLPSLLTPLSTPSQSLRATEHNQVRYLRRLLLGYMSGETQRFGRPRPLPFNCCPWLCIFGQISHLVMVG